MRTELSNLRDKLFRLTDIKSLIKEFDRVATDRFMRLFGIPRTVGAPRQGLKKKSTQKRSRKH